MEQQLARDFSGTRRQGLPARHWLASYGGRIPAEIDPDAHSSVLAMLESAKLKPGADVQVVNMGFAELADALKTGKIEALFVWDPWVENFVNLGLARVVASSVELTMVVAMHDDYRAKNPDVVEKFLKAHKEATLFAASNHDKTNTWFREPAAAQALSADIIEKATGFCNTGSAAAVSTL